MAPLIALFNATDGNYWYNPHSWLSENPVSEWHGITTNEEGRVTEIRLSSNALNGTLPPELGQLQHLQHLSLGANSLTGSIPESLADLPLLMHLSLENNQLSGPIPSNLGLEQSLSFVELTDNQLSGEIPSTLVRSHTLKHLNLSFNQLTGGIPREFHIRSGLEYLDLSYNRLTFEIPLEIERLRYLKELHLESNNLTDGIPTNLGKLPLLEVIHLHHNRLTGPIPIELSQMAELSHLYLDDNLVSGTIPKELAKAPNLWYLGVSDNHFTGCIPIELRDIYVSNVEFANVHFCDQPPRSEPYSPAYIEWEIGDTIAPSQELAARMGVERIARFVEKIGWPVPTETITVYLGDRETVARHYAHELSNCSLLCARGHFKYAYSDALPGAVFARPWTFPANGLSEQARRIAQETVSAIMISWLEDSEPLRTTWNPLGGWDPDWLSYGLPDLVDRLAVADQRNITYKEYRERVFVHPSGHYDAMRSLENGVGRWDRCPRSCTYAVEILASQVGLQALPDYYTQRVPHTNWEQTFEHTFNITVPDFYDLHKEHYDNAFPYLEIPLEGSTQWPWHVTVDE